MSATAAVKYATAEYLKHDLRGYGDRLYCCCGNWRGGGEVGFVEHRIAAIVKDVEADLRDRIVHDLLSEATVADLARLMGRVEADTPGLPDMADAAARHCATVVQRGTT